jgi:uncharacterized protein (DUF1015 family)
MESGLSTVPPYVAGPLQLAPFRAVSLAARRVGDPASARVFARPYRGVSQRLESWVKRGMATRDDVPTVYLHEYTDSGLTVRGVVGCLDVSHPAATLADRRILPHEGVHPQQVTELANRMETMRINPAPILLVHRGPASIREVSRKVRTGTPDRAYVDHSGQQHRVWAITDPAHLATIDAGLADARLLVADGHHRYAAYVALHGRDPRESRRCGLAMVVDQDETPLFLGAVHRVLHGTRLAELLTAASAAGAEVRTSDEPEAMAGLAPDTVVLTDGTTWATARLTVPPGSAIVQLVDHFVKRLPRPPSRVSFAHSVAQAIEQLRPERRVTAALLPAVDLDLVFDIVGTGSLLPEKATSFQPKPSLGSFIRLLDG